MKISIITATYNSSKTLSSTLESVLQQTHTDYEIIVVDGASTDSTLDILHQYAARFEGKLHMISEPDEGLYDAMNKGIRMATGDVIGILNSDDYYTSEHILQYINDALQNPHIDAIYGDIQYISINAPHKVVRYYSSRHFRPWMMRLGFIPAHPSFYCRREIIMAHPLFDTSFRVAADFELLLRLIVLHHISVQYLPHTFVNMRIGGASTSGWRSYVQGYVEHGRALQQNGVYSNPFYLLLGYLYKVVELIRTRLFHNRNSNIARR